MPGVRLVFAYLVLTTFAGAQALPTNLLSVPTKLQLDKTSAEVKRGATIHYTVSLKNGRNEPVTATEDLVIEVTTNKGKTQKVTLARGQSSANFTWVAEADGMVELTARSGKMLPASCLILVTNNMTAVRATLPGQLSAVIGHPAIAERPVLSANGAGHMVIRPHIGDMAGAIVLHPGGAGGETAATGAPPPGPAAAPSPAPSPAAPEALGLSVFIRPETVYGDAHSHTWQTKVIVAVQNPEGALAPVANDTVIFLTPEIGQLSVPSITIQHGDTSNFNAPVTLTSNRAGSDSVLAMSGLGKGTANVQYQLPQASRLQLAVGASEFAVDGSGVRNAAVCLEDAGDNFVAPDSDVQIRLTTTAGSPSFTDVVVPAKGFCSKEVKFSSRSAESGQLTAQSVMGLQADDAPITFPAFPWHLVWLAIAGGLLGAFVTSYGGIATQGLWAQTWRNLVVGAIFGGVTYLFACYGALVLPKEVPVVLENIPTASKIGAFLIGFLGGFLGRKLWKGADSATVPAEKKAA